MNRLNLAGTWGMYLGQFFRDTVPTDKTCLLSTFTKIYKGVKSVADNCNDETAAAIYKKLGAEVFWFSMDLNFLLRGYNETFDGIKELF